VTWFLLARVKTVLALARIRLFSRGRVKRTRRTRRNDASLHRYKALYLERSYVLEGIATILHSTLVEQRRHPHSPLDDVSRFSPVGASVTDHPFHSLAEKKNVAMLSRIYYIRIIHSSIIVIAAIIIATLIVEISQSRGKRETEHGCCR